METCADCGKPIEAGQASYYRKDYICDIGVTFHSECGDPFGTKAKNAEIVRLKQLVKEWRPIETAPKDGSWLLLWDANFNTTHNTPACVGRHNANNVWVNDVHATIKPPTHWMPLPNAPSLPSAL